MSGQDRHLVDDQLPMPSGLLVLRDTHTSAAGDLSSSVEWALPDRQSRLVQPGEIAVALPDEYEQRVAEDTVPSRPSMLDLATSTRTSPFSSPSFPWLGGPA
jgi:hypothetical protein